MTPLPGRRSRFRFGAIVLMGAIIGSPASATVRPSPLFAEHMVIQRGLPVHVWGDADPGEAVRVAFREETQTAVADALGRWSVYLRPGEAGGPFDLRIEGASLIEFHDVLVGDVWVASGQSNMELPLRLAADPEREIAAVNAPLIRFFRVLPHVADHPLDTLDPSLTKTWTICRPDTAAELSAVAWHFAREVHEHTGVPIGIVQSFWGGTPAEAWTSLGSLTADPALMPVFAYRASVARQREEELRRIAAVQRTYDAAVQQGTAAGLTDPSQEWRPNFDAWAPAALYNGMIAPLTTMPIAGVIWYQGESNSEPLQFPVYERLFTTLIRDWRHAWHQGDFPFLFVQLANYGTVPPDWNWPEVREAQRRALAVANTAMAVAIDVGEHAQIHPGDKRTVGHRLALAARAIVYGEAVEFSGPMPRSAVFDETQVLISFDHADGGLVARDGPLVGFEIAGPDGSFVPAEAVIDGSSVVLTNPQISAPRRARYAWAADPYCNLYNQAGLPASPFRTDD